MWHPVYIKGINWGPYKELSLDFKRGEPHLVLGQNNFDESQESNGSGKSYLEELLFYLLIGDSSRGVTDVKLINYDESSSHIEGQFYNSFLKQTLTINRSLFRSSSSKLVINLDTETEPIKFSSITEGNKKILSLIGITREDLQNYFILNREKYNSFFKITDKSKKDLISRFNSYEKINKIDLILDSHLSSLNEQLIPIQKSLLDFESKKTGFLAQKTLLESQIQEENEINFEEKKKEKIAELESQINECKRFLTDAEQTEKTLLDEIKTKESLILKETKDSETFSHTKLMLDKSLQQIQTKFELVQTEIKTNSELLQKKSNTLTVCRQEVEKLVSSISEVLESLTLAKNLLAGTIVCPKCHFEFLLDSEMSLDDIKQLVADLSLENSNLDSQKKDRDSELLKFKSEKDQIQSLIEKSETLFLTISKEKRQISEKIQSQLYLINTSKSKIEDLQSQILLKKNSIKSLSEQVKFQEKTIKELDLQILTIQNSDNKEGLDRIKKLESQIEALNQEILKQDLEIEKVTEQKSICEQKIQDYSQWNLLFVKFKFFLANQSLGILQRYSNLYLSKMKSNLSVKFEGYKVLSDKQIKENITPYVFRNGFLEGEFKQFSGGEKGKLDLSFILTAQKLINLSTDTGGLDICWIDEILDSVDGLGMTSLLSSMSDIHRTVLLSTHISHGFNKGNIIYAIKDIHGVSHIEQNSIN